MDNPSNPPPRLPERYAFWPDASRALLGRGGAGEVWRARDQSLGVLVALKVLRVDGTRVRSRLGREAALAARVVHPNVVGIHDVGDTPDGNAYVAFALASDGSMLELSGNLPPWSELLELIADLMNALSALHARGVLHLDVKLSNLLLHRAGPRRRTLWLADLGIARALQEAPDDEKTVLGTVSYMASERLTGQRHLWCPATDLFSVGAILWRLVTGNLPFPARDPVAALASRRHVPDSMVVREGYAVPPGLDEVLTPMLAYDRRGRYDTAADALRALRALPSVGHPSRPRNPSGRPALRIPGVQPWHRPAPRPMPADMPPGHVPRRAPQSLALLSHREIPLTGREAEMDILWGEARAVAQARAPRVVHVSGPRGIGRTRLVQELTRVLEQEGYGEGVMLEYAVRDRSAIGLRGAWRRLAPPEPEARGHTDHLVGQLSRQRGKPRPEVLEDAAAITRWLMPGPDDAPVDQAAPRLRMAEHLQASAWRGLAWIWLEDLHLAEEDDDVWLLLDLLLSRQAPVLVIATSREDQRLERLLTLTRRFATPSRALRLEPLTPASAAALVNAYLPLEQRLRHALVRHTSGNPRHIQDLLLHWVRTRALMPQPDAGPEPIWCLTADAPPLPRDRDAFASELLGWALSEDPELFPALLATALSGRGTPERVIARVAPEALDRAVLAGLVTLERGAPVLLPPELPSAVRAWPRPQQLDRDLHSRLAEAWASEGGDPAVLVRIGQHYASAGRFDLALPPFDRALRSLVRTLPALEARRLAQEVLEVASNAPPPGGTGSPAWARAAMALADAHWMRGETNQARAWDERLASLPLPPVEAVRAAALFASHLGREETRLGLARMARVSHLLPEVPGVIQAEFYCTRGRSRSRMLDDDGALEDYQAALALGPDPVTETTARYFRAMVLGLRGSDESYKEALRAVELARAHGLTRWEALAWGALGEQLWVRGRTEEALKQMREAVARLRSQGDYLFAGTLFNNMGELLRRAGRDDEARATYRAILEDPAFRVGDIPALASANLAIMHAVEREGEALLTECASLAALEDDPQVGSAWLILEPIGALLCGQSPPLPDVEALSRAVKLGPDGVFADLALAALLEERGRMSEARAIERTVQLACERYQVDPDPAEPMLARFRERRNLENIK